MESEKPEEQSLEKLSEKIYNVEVKVEKMNYFLEKLLNLMEEQKNEIRGLRYYLH